VKECVRNISKMQQWSNIRLNLGTSPMQLLHLICLFCSAYCPLKKLASSESVCFKSVLIFTNI
jgi:hypothetical protein